MRQQKGDKITLMDGKGSLATAQIDSIEKARAHLTILSKKSISKSPTILSIAIAHIRPQKFDDCLEQIVALGVDKIYTFPAKKQ